MKTNEERRKALLSILDNLAYIKPEEIPNIQLYMDQVTTFMEEHLGHTKRYPEDKVLTKTMINNYAKNNLLPAPVKKKYSKEHMLMLIFIYYFKNVLSFNDIQQIFKPITSRYFTANPSENSSFTLEDVYSEVFSLEKTQLENLKQDISSKFRLAEDTFQDFSGTEEEREYLRLFAVICQLSFDVYLKTQMIEALTDELRSEEVPGTDKRRK